MEAGPSTPRRGTASARSRICKKLVLKGQASSEGATYTLFLKIQLPHQDHGQDDDHVLFAGSGIELHEAIVHRLDATGAAPALSTSAATAASHLGIPLSVHHEMNDSFVQYESPKSARWGSTAAPPDRSPPPSIIRSDQGVVMLRSTRDSASGQSAGLFMVTLHLSVPPASSPPLAPFAVRMAVPFCLNNFMRFTVDESISQQLGMPDIAVEVDPPILPVSSARPSSRRHSSASVLRSSDEDDDTLTGIAAIDVSDADVDQDESTIAGPFQASDALVVRFASEQAGDLVLGGSAHHTLPNALRAQKARSSITYSPRRPAGADDEARLIDFEAEVRLVDAFFPGLDREVQLFAQLDARPSLRAWHVDMVDASRGILSWSFGSSASTAPCPSRQPETSAQAMLCGRSSLEIGDMVILPGSVQQAVDDEDLLKVAPPKGIDDADFDFSLDQGAGSNTKKRRFSLQSSASTKLLASQPPSEASETASAASNMLVIAFNLLPVLQSTDPVIINVRGSLSVDVAAHIALDQLPRALIIPSALVQEHDEPTLATPLEPCDEERTEEKAPLQQKKDPEGQQTKEDSQSKAPETASSDEIIRQALAVIAAHKELLKQDAATAMRASATRVPPTGGASDAIVRTSHLLWTLFLTAVVAMLFSATQSTNRALLARIDELSRIVETGRFDASVSAQSSVGRDGLADSAIESLLQVPSVSEAGLDVEDDVGRLLEPVVPRGSRAGTRPADLVEPLVDSHPTWLDSGAVGSQPVWPGSGIGGDEEVRPGPPATGLAHSPVDWMQALLRAPLLLLRRLLNLFAAV